MRYLIFSVEFAKHYRRHFGDPGASWFGLPEGLELTEDGPSEYTRREGGENLGCWQRKWAGLVSDEAVAELRSDWGCDPEDSEPNLGMLTELGWLEGERHNFDGMDWDMGGRTPVLFADLSISEPLST